MGNTSEISYRVFRREIIILEWLLKEYLKHHPITNQI